jgi:hypothetical protein
MTKRIERSGLKGWMLSKKGIGKKMEESGRKWN